MSHSPRETAKTRLKRAVQVLAERPIDRRTTVGKALTGWQRELIEDLGGRDQISTQELAVVELCVRLKLLLDSIDAWLLTQASLINRRRRSLHPIVLQRQSLADALVRHLTALGLKRRATTIDVAVQLARMHAPRDGHDPDTPRSQGNAPSDRTAETRTDAAN